MQSFNRGRGGTESVRLAAKTAVSWFFRGGWLDLRGNL